MCAAAIATMLHGFLRAKKVCLLMDTRDTQQVRLDLHAQPAVISMLNQ